MVLPTPNLDDRSFDQLVREALDHVRRRNTDWTDLSANDPGVVLIEAFAHLTELMLFRMNQLPDKAYVAFLDLLGVQPHPPIAAHARLEFTLDDPAPEDRTLPAGLSVEVEGAGDGGTPVRFETLETATIAAGQTAASVLAGHCVSHRGELLGRSSGQPRQSFPSRLRPILAPDQIGQGLIVAVETGADEDLTQETTIEHGGKAFVIWREVAGFTPDHIDQKVFCVDRYLGLIRFAPDLRLERPTGELSARPRPLAAVPRQGAEIRLWYRTAGDGPGRVAAGRLTALTPRQDGLSVTNPAASVAGRAAESLENALQRGPMTLHSLDRAITARDFETLATRASGGVNRALAMADAALWSHGTRGAVNVSLVPQSDSDQPAITAADLTAAQQPSVLDQVQRALDARRALGTSCLVHWARFKPVSVRLRADLTPGQDHAAVTARIHDRLNQLINPLNRGPDLPGWGFGRSLFSWDVLRAIGDLPGVAGLSNIRLGVDAAPDTDVATLSRDAYQPDTWYTAKGPVLFRSGNNGASWETGADFGAEQVVLVQAYDPSSGDVAGRAGLVCAVTAQDETSRLYLSRDCGQSFDQISQFQFEVNAAAWIFRDRVPSLLLAGKTGLFEVLASPGAAPRQLLVNPDDPQMGVSSVAVSLDLQGRVLVAVSGAGEQGVYLSASGGESGTYTPVGLAGELVRVLMIQQTTTQRWLWAGVSAVGNDIGKGCFRALLQSDGLDTDGWTAYSEAWVAGGCRTLAHDGRHIYAGSLRRGVLVLEPDGDDLAWRTPDVSCGLPLRDVSRLEPVNALAAAAGCVMAGGPRGVFASHDQGVSYASCSMLEFENEVKLPPAWVFCGGEHRVEIAEGDDADI